ncbi:MAG: hypothetical protein FWG66_13570 [Spirochaetes bacterium]|nr:hypothetical protein [Spirochaetota bacterium]
MTITEFAAAIGAEVCHRDFDDAKLAGAYASDLLSDVVANANANARGIGADAGASALITVQAHINTVAVASLVDISLIIICNSRPIPGDMLEAAKRERIAILRTGENQFTVSAQLWKALFGKA